MTPQSFTTSTLRRAAGKADVKLVWLLLTIPLAYVVVNRSVAYLGERRLHDGDRLETRDCRECGGKGHDEKYAKDFNGIGMNCMACLGSGEVQVIAPGPKRPTKVWGTVIDWKAGDAKSAHECPKHIRLDFGSSIMLSSNERAIQGALSSILVSFKADGDRILARTGLEGRFHARLPPGRYVVEVEAEGFAKLQSELLVEPLIAPIWLEKNKIIRERSRDERIATDGLAVILLLERPGEGKGMLRTFLVPE